MTDRPAGLFLGLATLDILYGVNGAPARNSKYVATRQALYAGGPATNAAVAFAALGGDAKLAAIVGRHPLTELMREDLRDCAVEVHDLARGFEGAPSFSSVLVDQSRGERMVVSANATRLPEVKLNGHLVTASGVDVLMVDGHLMEAAIEAAELARSIGILTVFDGGSWKNGTERLLPHVDVAICSHNFAPPGTKSEEDVLQYLGDCGVGKRAISRGERPIRFVEGAREGEVAVPAVEAVDTLGAGDILHGAFCFFYAKSGAFEESLGRAAETASLSCRSFGTRDWMRRR